MYIRAYIECTLALLSISSIYNDACNSVHDSLSTHEHVGALYAYDYESVHCDQTPTFYMAVNRQLAQKEWVQSLFNLEFSK